MDGGRPPQRETNSVPQTVVEKADEEEEEEESSPAAIAATPTPDREPPKPAAPTQPRVTAAEVSALVEMAAKARFAEWEGRLNNAMLQMGNVIDTQVWPGCWDQRGKKGGGGLVPCP